LAACFCHSFGVSAVLIASSHASDAGSHDLQARSIDPRVGFPTCWSCQITPHAASPTGCLPIRMPLRFNRPSVLAEWKTDVNDLRADTRDAANTFFLWIEEFVFYFITLGQRYRADLAELAGIWSARRS
jgi:hypothetical protein